MQGAQRVGGKIIHLKAELAGAFPCMQQFQLAGTVQRVGKDIIAGNIKAAHGVLSVGVGSKRGRYFACALVTCE